MSGIQKISPMEAGDPSPDRSGRSANESGGSIAASCPHDRIFVCDPVCVQGFGHNVHALEYFRRYLEPHCREVVTLCSRFLPERIAMQYRFRHFFDLYYDFAVDATRADEPILDARGFNDVNEWRATRDFRDFFDHFSVCEDDSVVFPHLDFYGVLGLLNAVLELPRRNWPRVYLRYIGVMENATSTYDKPLAELNSRVRHAIAAGLRVRISAETPRYADLLSHVLGVPVLVTLFPLENRLLPLPDKLPFVVLCPGSARLDKGFSHLWQIFSEVRRRDPELAIRLVTQSLPDREMSDWETHISQLYALPGVEVLPAVLSKGEIYRCYSRSHLVLLPYDVETYRWRGSASMMEAAAFGRRVLTLRGTAFAEQVEYYGLGRVVPDITTVPDAVLAEAETSRSDYALQAMQAHCRFDTNISGSLRKWLQVQ